MKFWEAMKAIDEGKKVYPISYFWVYPEYLDHTNVLSWFESSPAYHFYLDEWGLIDYSYREEFRSDTGIRFLCSDGVKNMKPGVAYDENLNEI